MSGQDWFEKKVLPLPKGNTRLCLIPFSKVFVLQNNGIGVCCAESLKFYPIKLGHISSERPLADVWNGEIYRNIRTSLLTGKNLEMACVKCERVPAVDTEIMQLHVALWMFNTFDYDSVRPVIEENLTHYSRYEKVLSELKIATFSLEKFLGKDQAVMHWKPSSNLYNSINTWRSFSSVVNNVNERLQVKTVGKLFGRARAFLDTTIGETYRIYANIEPNTCRGRIVVRQYNLDFSYPSDPIAESSVVESGSARESAIFTASGDRVVIELYAMSTKPEHTVNFSNVEYETVNKEIQRTKKMSKENIGTYLSKGRLMKKEGRLEEAIDIYKKAVAINPNFSWSYYFLGEVLGEKGIFNEALEVYRQGLQLNPDSAHFLHAIGSVFLKQKQLEQAVNFYEKAISKDHRGRSEFYDDLGTAKLLDGKFEEAITYYQKAIRINPKIGRYYNNLGEAFAKIENYDKAAEYYQKAIQCGVPELGKAYFSLGKTLSKLCQVDRGLTTFNKSVNIYLEAKAEESGIKDKIIHFLSLGMAITFYSYQQYFQNINSHYYNDVKRPLVVSRYKKALIEMPEIAKEYLNILLSLTQEGNLKLALECCCQILDGDSEGANFFYDISLFLSEQGLLNEAIVCLKKAPHPQILEYPTELNKLEEKPSQEQIYESMWGALNQPKRQLITQELRHYPKTLSYSKHYQSITKYFQNNSQYKVIKIHSLTSLDKHFIENSGWSMANLELIGHNSLYLEDIYINSYKENGYARLELLEKNTNNIPERTKKSPHYVSIDDVAFQQTIVKTGYMYSVCPNTGKIIRSNHSFYISRGNSIITVYRFVGAEVFYILVGDMTGDKKFVYFPRVETLLMLNKFDFSWGKDIQEYINNFKADVVFNWHQVKDYVTDDSRKQVASILGSHHVLGHHVYNELPAIQLLQDNGLIKNLDKFLVGHNEFFKFSNIFPEINPTKIVSIERHQTFGIKWLQENYFVVRLTQSFITKDLIERIYQSSVEKCSQDFLKQVQEAKKNSPLLWINIRSHNRVWSSQVEGITNIINKLYEEFPNLGVVFNGWSRVEKGDSRMNNSIAAEKAIVQEILELISPNISIYDTIGCSIYESVVWGRAIDVFLGTAGTGLLTFVTWISSKPGLLHGNKLFNTPDERYYCHRENPAAEPLYVPLKDIKDLGDNRYSCNYSVDWKVVYQYLLQVINDCVKKNTLSNLEKRGKLNSSQ